MNIHKRVAIIKYLTIVLVLVIVSGCTTLGREYKSEQLHQEISTGNIIQVGDRVQVVTSDGMTHEFTVEAITENSIMGKKKISAEPNIYEDIDIPITDIVSLKKRYQDYETPLVLVAAALGVFWVAAGINLGAF